MYIIKIRNIYPYLFISTGLEMEENIKISKKSMCFEL